MVMCCSFPVPKSLAETFKIPFASISKVTSICGTPRGAGAIPSKSNLPSGTLSLAMGRSPCNTLMVTAGWLSDAVENTCVLRTGIVVLRSMRRVHTPPNVSKPKESGVTSKSSTSFTSPVKIPACTEAPIATHSIGSIPRSIFLPTWSSTYFCTIGIRVGPPTKIMRSIWLADKLASESAWSMDLPQRFTMSPTKLSSLARESVSAKCFGPVASAVI